MSARTRRRALSAVLCSGALLVAGATTASAGEIAGNGKDLRVAPHVLHGKSACAWSGQNDEYHLVSTSYPRVQTPGHTMLEGLTPPGVPGMACNPTRGFEE